MTTITPALLYYSADFIARGSASCPPLMQTKRWTWAYGQDGESFSSFLFRFHSFFILSFLNSGTSDIWPLIFNKWGLSTCLSFPVSIFFLSFLQTSYKESLLDLFWTLNSHLVLLNTKRKSFASFEHMRVLSVGLRNLSTFLSKPQLYILHLHIHTLSLNGIISYPFQYPASFSSTLLEHQRLFNRVKSFLKVLEIIVVDSLCILLYLFVKCT